ncbi:hypothetical protein LINGRAHAP2_LOCUS32959 [Linum grandiflorum]
MLRLCLQPPLSVCCSGQLSLSLDRFPPLLCVLLWM